MRNFSGEKFTNCFLMRMCEPLKLRFQPIALPNCH